MKQPYNFISQTSNIKIMGVTSNTAKNF